MPYILHWQEGYYQYGPSRSAQLVQACCHSVLNLVTMKTVESIADKKTDCC